MIKRSLASLMIGAMLAMLLIQPTPAYALDCAVPSPIDEAYEQFDAIVVGQAERSLKGAQRTNSFSFNIDRSFKGVTESPIKISESADWGIIRSGQTYLLFLQKEGANWKVPLCSPIKLVGQAEQELSWLENKEISVEHNDSARYLDMINSKGQSSVIVLIAAVIMLLAAVVAVFLLYEQNRYTS